MSEYALTITDQQWTVTLSSYSPASSVSWTNLVGYANHIPFSTDPIAVPTVAGTFWWNDTDGTLDLRLKGGNVTLPLGQKQIIRAVNKTGTNLLAAQYKAVRVTGAQGQRLKVELARGDNDLNSATAIGVAAENIDDNQEGFITTSGMVSGINATGSLFGETWAEGDVLYLSPTTFGALTKFKPVAPQHLIVMGWVVHATSNGSIFVKVDNGYELDELHNVSISSAVNGQPLVYDSSTGVWRNSTTITVTTVTATGAIIAGGSTVAGLPSPASSVVGSRRHVTDATSTTFMSVVAGGGSNKVPVFFNGTNWVIG